jgi:hypothetical protein
MILSVMKPRNAAVFVLILVLSLVWVATPASGEKKKDQLVKPMAGPRAAALRITWLYVAPDTSSQKVDRPWA